MIRILALAMLLLLPHSAEAVPEVTEVSASGLTRQEAITNGLIQALEQVRGVSMTSASSARAELSSTGKGDERTSTITEQQQSATVKLTGGYVSSYQVLSVASGMPVEVQLSVTIEVFAPTGLGNDTRRRIAVLAFAVPDASARAPSPIAALLRDRITAQLVQARRFAVLDRAEGGAYSQEMQMLSRDAPMSERVRMGQVLGADYLVMGKFRQTSGTQSSRVIELTGEVVTNSTAGSTEADYQVIEIATRQIKFAATVRIAGTGGVDPVSARIAAEITQAIYPMRLIKFTDSENLIIGQGGDSLKPGQRFRAMVLGEALSDPYTKEALGQAEDEAGVVEIKRVDSKLSYARLVSGHLPAPSGDDVQIVLRPSLPSVTPAATRPRPPTVAAPTITKLPFDR